MKNDIYSFTATNNELCAFMIINEDQQIKLLRALIIRMMIKFQHEDLPAQCKALFDAEVRGEDTIPADARFAVIFGTVSIGDEDIIKTVVKVHIKMIIGYLFQGFI
jgi:hypothetical protein